MKPFAVCAPLLIAIACPLAAQEPPANARPLVLVRTAGKDLPLPLAVAFAVSDSPGVLLLDGPATRTANERFIEAWRPSRCDVIDPEPDADRSLLPKSPRAVVCLERSRRALIGAAGLAVAARAALIVLSGQESPEQIAARLDRRGVREVLLVAFGDAPAPALDSFIVRRFADEAAVQNASIEYQCKCGPIDTIVLVNPADRRLSNLAPLVMRGRNAVLAMTNDRGSDAGDVVRLALEHPELQRVENLLILAKPESIPSERRDNPLAGKDEHIEMEPGTPRGQEPYTLAIGRLFHSEPGFVALALARSRLLPPSGSSRSALVASNPGGSLPLLETCSRTSARELQNCGYKTTTLFGDQLSPEKLRRRLPDADLFLWEGHHNTLINDWGFSKWTEPLPPSLMFLQSCLALTEEKAMPLVDRGALAVLGSSSRIYSATGGAFSLAYLDSVLYEQQSIGGALRSAKNFLLAYGLLKEKRLNQVKLAGANQRSAWAFTLWGDPGLRLPAPPLPVERSTAVRCNVRGDAITLFVPPAVSEASGAGKYHVPFRANARLAGLLRPGDDGDKLLVPFAFAEIAFPHAPPGATPRLKTKIADANWVFVWDARRRSGFLLAVPPTTAERDLRFKVEWESVVQTHGK